MEFHSTNGIVPSNLPDYIVVDFYVNAWKPSDGYKRQLTMPPLVQIIVAWSAPSHYLNKCWNIANIGPLRTSSSEILIEIHTFSFKKMRSKISSPKWWSCCLVLNMLMDIPSPRRFLGRGFGHQRYGYITSHYPNYYGPLKTYCTENLFKIIRLFRAHVFEYAVYNFSATQICDVHCLYRGHILLTSIHAVLSKWLWFPNPTFYNTCSWYWPYCHINTSYTFLVYSS